MITKVTFKTNKNLGNMEHESVELEYTMTPQFETAQEVFDNLRDTAYKMLGINEEPKPKPKPVVKQRRTGTKKINK